MRAGDMDDEGYEWLAARRDYAEFIATTYAGVPGYLNLVSGDKIIEAGEFAGLTERERDTVPWVVMDKKMGVPVRGDADNAAVYWDLRYRSLKDPVGYAALVERENRNIRDWAVKFGPPGIYAKARFDNFIVTTPEQDYARKGVYCWPVHPDDFALDFSEQRRYTNMVIAGHCGTGKTHLLAALFNKESRGEGNTPLQYAQFNQRKARVLSARQTAAAEAHAESLGEGYTRLMYARFHAESGCEGGPVFIRWADLVKLFKAKGADTAFLYDAYGTGEIGWPYDIYEGVGDTLLIDDIGVDRDAFSADVFGEIIDRRVTNGLSTIVTTNLNDDVLLTWLGERAVSRLSGACKRVQVTGDDFRRRVR